MSLGRPSIYSIDLAAEICERISRGESLASICRDDRMPTQAAIYKWLLQKDKAEFVEMYTRAREDQADILADEIIQIADDGANDTYKTDDGEQVNHDVIARSRLRVDARKWVAAKLKPRKYGDKIEHSSDPDAPLVVQIVQFSEQKK